MRDLISPPTQIPFLNDNGRNSATWTTWLNNLFGNIYPVVRVKGYATADLVTANGLDPADVVDAAGSGIIYVTDAAGGASTAYSDGTNWISHKTGAAV